MTLCEAPTRETRPDHNTGNYVGPTLFDKCVGFFTSPANHVTLNKQKTGPAVVLLIFLGIAQSIY